MKRSLLSIPVILAAMTSQAFALCNEGPPYACIINGKPGTRQCADGRITACIPNGGSVKVQSATLAPKYFVLTVVYAPPGTQGGMSTSSVSYGSGSTTGTTTSATKSFKEGVSVTATTGAGLLGNGASVGVSFGYSATSTDASSLNITKSSSTTIQATGPSANGIDHDHDIIYLWLNPTVNVTVTSTAAAWSVNGSGTADIQYVYVGWLKNPSQMPPGVAQILNNYGLNAQDYATILQRDQFASGSPAITARYLSLNMTFPYEPPYSATDPVPTTNFTLTNAQTATNTTTLVQDYTVGLTVKTGTDFIAEASLEVDDSWDWTNTTANASSNETMQSAAVTVGGPAFGYTGPTDIQVYYDRMFKTFLFSPIDASERPAFKGMLTGLNGQPIARQEVTAVAAGVTYRTFTDARGEYRVFGKISGPVTVKANGVTQVVPRIQPNQNIDLRQR